MPAHPANSTDAHLRLSLSSSSLPRRDYQSLRLVIFSLRLELPRCRRNVTDARCVPQLRDCSGMVPQVRPDLRQRLAPQVSFKSVPRLIVTDKLRSYSARLDISSSTSRKHKEKRK